LKYLKQIIVLTILTFPIWATGQVSAGKLYDTIDQLVDQTTHENLLRLESTAENFSTTITSTDDQLALVIAYCNLGYYFKKEGNLDNSISYYQDGYDRFAFHQLKNYDIYENAVVPLASIYTQQGDYLKAEELLKKCFAQAKNTKNSSLLINSILSLSALYNSTSRPETSIKLLHEALENSGLPIQTEAILKNNLATAYIGMGGFDKAKKVLTEITELEGLSHVNTYKSLAFIALKEMQSEKASEYFNQAKNSLLQNPNASAHELINLQIEEAELLLESNQPAAAIESLRKAMDLFLHSYSGSDLPTKAQLYPNRNFLRIFDIYAASTTSLEETLKAYDLAFHTSELLQWSYTSQETKILHQAEVKHRTEKCIDLLWQRYTKTKEAKWAEMAFQYAEKNKASVLSEMVAIKTETANTKNLVFRDLEKILQKREKLTDQLLRAQFKNLAPEIVNDISAELEVVDGLLAKLQNKIPRKPQKDLDIAEVQQKLKTDDASLLSYFMGTESAYQFTVDTSGLQMVRLANSKNLAPEILNFVHLFDSPDAINNDVPNFTKSAFSVFEALQLKNGLESKNLVIIPDGLLNFLPFESLLTANTSGTSFQKMPFLINDHNIGYALNVQKYLNANSNSTKNSVLGLFPVFEGSNDELSYSITESEALKKYMAAELLLKEDATKSTFIEKAKNHNILHLSTHAASGDFIVPAHIQFRDDLLYLPELNSLDMTGKTIILSACETGIGKLQKGEGALSVARGFQYAGASSVLFSLWKVNDQSTASLMSRFYESFETTGSVFESNRAAKLTYLNDPSIPTTKKSPYYWNGFAYYGAVDVTEDYDKKYFPYIAFCALLSALFIFWLNRKKKK